MPDPNGFLRYERRLPARRPVPVRILDWREVYPPAPDELVREQATRCMDCGIPFCHEGCPLGNRIPDWNDLVRTGSWAAAVESLHATNNFPEFTGRLCPAPCEAACVLGIAGGEPVTIKQVEVEIANHAFDLRPAWRRSAGAESSGRRVAVVGSGPAGLAAAQQLARAGHAVTVYERDDAIGGLLRYGIPDFKLEKAAHRPAARAAGRRGRALRDRRATSASTSPATHAARRSTTRCCWPAARWPAATSRHPGPGSCAACTWRWTTWCRSNRRGRPACTTTTPIDAAGKHVVIIGGGDTAADCLGVAHRQGAAGVHQLDLYPLPPDDRDEERDPWPTWPWILRNYPAHEEGGERVFAVAVQEFVDDGAGAGAGGADRRGHRRASATACGT